MKRTQPEGETLMRLQRIGELEVMQDLEFERRSWRVQAWMRLGLLLLLIAGGIGLFGQGPLAGDVAGEENDPVRVEYARFVRYRSDGRFEVRLRAGAVSGDHVRFWIDRRYIDGIEIEHIVPQPESVEAGPDRYTYVFKLARPGAATKLLFDATPAKYGIRDARAGLEGGTELHFRQMVWP
jgi:hypothetical protein